MSEEIIKERKPVRFFKKIRGYRRFLLFTGIYIGLFLILVAGSAEYTSRPAVFVLHVIIWKLFIKAGELQLIIKLIVLNAILNPVFQELFGEN